MREFNLQFRLKSHLETAVFVAVCWVIWHIEVSNFFFLMAYVMIYNVMAIRVKLRDVQSTLDDELADADDWDIVPSVEKRFEVSTVEEAGRRAMAERNAARDAQFRSYVDANWPPENRDAEIPRA